MYDVGGGGVVLFLFTILGSLTRRLFYIHVRRRE